MSMTRVTHRALVFSALCLVNTALAVALPYGVWRVINITFAISLCVLALYWFIITPEALGR